MACSRMASGWAERASVVRDVQDEWMERKSEHCSASMSPGGSWT